MVLADTTFLIDLQRSSRNLRHRHATDWLAENEGLEIALPAIVLGEFAGGFEDERHPVVEHYRLHHRILEIDERVAIRYSRISRELRQKGEAIGGNDTWIAAVAMTFDVPLLTRNVSYFRRVGGIEIVEYGRWGEG